MRPERREEVREKDTREGMRAKEGIKYNSYTNHNNIH